MCDAKKKKKNEDIKIDVKSVDEERQGEKK